MKKRGRLHYGYKQHTATNEEGLVLALITTSANESDTKHVEDVLDKMHTQHMMQAIAYNLYRNPGIIVSCCEKQTIK